jgi:hypothetical protein
MTTDGMVRKCNVVSPEIDVVFVHGLQGHRDDTWVNPDATGNWFNWLAEDIPTAQLWAYGYPAAISRWWGHAMTLYDRAQNFRQHLLANGIGTRPLVFVTHSLGGLVVKKMLREAKDSKHTDHQDLFFNTRGIAFLATPHFGSSWASLLNMLPKLLWMSEAISSLLYDSTELLDLNDWFRNQISPQVAVQVLIETKRIGCFPKLLTSTTSDPGIAHQEKCTVDENHIGICKPLTKDHISYMTVAGFLKKRLSILSRPDNRETRLPSTQLAATGRNEPPARLYLDSEGVEERVRHLLDWDKTDSEMRKAVVLTAPTGFGKTTLGRTLFYKWSGTKLIHDARIGGLPDHIDVDLAIVDHVDSLGREAGGGSARKVIQRLAASCRRLLICTSDRGIADAVMGLIGRDASHQLVDIPPFSARSGLSYLERYIEKPNILKAFTASELAGLIDGLEGTPVMVDILLQLLDDGGDRVRSLLQECTDGRCGTLRELVFDRWLDHIRAKEDAAALALPFLCSDAAPFGLSETCLRFVLKGKISEKSLNETLTRLRKKGLLLPALPGIDDTLVPHRILKDAIRTRAADLARPSEEWKRRLEKYCVLESDNSQDFLSQATSWLWRTSDSFRRLLSGRVKDEDRQDQLSWLAEHSRSLEKLSPKGRVDPALMSTLLGSMIGSQELEDCTVACTICRLLAKVHPQSGILGDVIWELRKHSDTMSCADAVRAAGIHWTAHQGDMRARAVEELDAFICDAQHSYDKSSPAGDYNGDPLTASFAIAAAVGARVGLGKEELPALGKIRADHDVIDAVFVLALLRKGSRQFGHAIESLLAHQRMSDCGYSVLRYVLSQGHIELSASQIKHILRENGVFANRVLFAVTLANHDACFEYLHEEITSGRLRNEEGAVPISQSTAKEGVLDEEMFKKFMEAMKPRTVEGRSTSYSNVDLAQFFEKLSGAYTGASQVSSPIDAEAEASWLISKLRHPLLSYTDYKAIHLELYERYRHTNAVKKSGLLSMCEIPSRRYPFVRL